jgi:hypothetical protein
VERPYGRVVRVPARRRHGSSLPDLGSAPGRLADCRGHPPQAESNGGCRRAPERPEVSGWVRWDPGALLHAGTARQPKVLFRLLVKDPRAMSLQEILRTDLGDDSPRRKVE